MPKLADTLVEGTLGQWFKQVGDNVSQGEPLASIETDKVTTELTSPAAGTLLEMLVDEGQTVPVETPIARIGDASSVLAAPPPPPPPSATIWDAPLKTTPVAARLLAEHGLTRDQIPTQSVRLKRDDVLAYVERRAQPAADLIPLTSMRRAIAEHMLRHLARRGAARNAETEAGEPAGKTREPTGRSSAALADADADAAA